MSQTAIYAPEACLRHEPGPGHPESPERFRAAVAALELLYEQPTGIALASLTELSRRFARAAGRELPPNKPISGSAAFVHTLPTHREAISRDSRSIQAFEPELVGNVERQENRPQH